MAQSRKRARPKTVGAACKRYPGAASQIKAKAQTKGLGGRRMNQTEMTMRDALHHLANRGMIAGYTYEPDKLKLAYRCTYTPDFKITMHNGSVVYIETKGGHVWDDAIVKFKVAGVLNPDRWFVWAQLKGGRWIMQLWRCGNPIRSAKSQSRLAYEGLVEVIFRNVQD